MSSTDLNSKPRTTEEKLQGIYYLNKHGATQSAITKTVELPKSTVQYIVSRIQQTGSPLPEKPPGAPKKISKRAQRQLERSVKRDSSVIYGKLKLDKEVAEFDVCKATIISCLKEKTIQILCCGAHKSPLFLLRDIRKK